MAVKNITVAVDNEIYEQARRLAAARNTSVSALVKEFLTTLRAVPQSAARQQVLQLQAEFAAMAELQPGSADKLAGYNQDGTFE